MEPSKEAAQSLQPPPRGDGRVDAPEEPRRDVLRPRTGEEGRRERDLRRKWMRVARRGFLAVVILGAVAGVVLALRPRPVPVDVATAARGRLVVAIEETGIARVKDRYVVSAPVPGTVFRQLLEPGDPVEEGRVVAEIAPLRSPLLDARTRSEA